MPTITLVLVPCTSNDSYVQAAIERLVRQLQLAVAPLLCLEVLPPVAPTSADQDLRRLVSQASIATSHHVTRRLDLDAFLCRLAASVRLQGEKRIPLIITEQPLYRVRFRVEEPLSGTIPRRVGVVSTEALAAFSGWDRTCVLHGLLIQTTGRMFGLPGNALPGALRTDRGAACPSQFCAMRSCLSLAHVAQLCDPAVPQPFCTHCREAFRSELGRMVLPMAAPSSPSL